MWLAGILHNFLCITEPMDPVVKDNIHGNESFRVNIEPLLSTGHGFIWYTHTFSGFCDHMQNRSLIMVRGHRLQM